MEFLQQLFLYIGFTALIFLVIGLFRPWIMLWWEDVQNRRKILKIYGTVAVISFALHFFMNLIIT